jgi:hypothetical protein
MEMSVTGLSVLWLRLDQPGHVSARLSFRHGNWHLSGTAAFAHDRQPRGLDDLVACDKRWHTLSGRAEGWVGDKNVEIAVSADSARLRRLNGKERQDVTGCIDLDLNFSPSSNLLPVRRLNLGIGEGAEARPAWFRSQSFTLEPLAQLYHRVDFAT